MHLVKKTFIHIFKIFLQTPVGGPPPGTDRGSKLKRECPSLEQKQSKTHSPEQEAIPRSTRFIKLSAVWVAAELFQWQINVVYTNRDNVDGLVTRPRAACSGIRSLAGEEIFLLYNVRSGTRAHMAPYSVGTGVLSLGKSSRSVKLTIHLHLPPTFFRWSIPVVFSVINRIPGYS